MGFKIFDINSFLRRNNWVQADLAEKLECSTSLVGIWASTDQTPSFDKCVKLLELGMTVEEMFGTELAEKAQLFAEPKQKEIVNENEFEDKVGEAIINLVSKNFFKLTKEA
jgi:transcriptional regulator with XRE-family HTH domain